jgi:hypothetical protein
MINFEIRKQELPKESAPGNRHTADHDGKTFDVYKLIHAAEPLPVETINITDIESGALKNCWNDRDGKKFGPHQIIEVAKRYHGQPNWDEIEKEHPEWAAHIQKIKNVSSRPVLLVGNILIDGAHRLTKTVAEMGTEIQVRKFEELPEDAVIPSVKSTGN